MIGLSDELNLLHGKRSGDIYVILSKDGSTVVKDPGMNRPWSSRNKKFADHMAKKVGGVAVDLITATQALIKHPKNLPPGALPPPTGL